jgi:hypothetical protein
MTEIERRKRLTVLVERNVPNIQPEQVHPIVNELIFGVDFWHAVSTVQKRLDQCPCELCLGLRFRREYVK